MLYINAVDTGQNIKTLMESSGKSVMDVVNAMYITKMAMYKWFYGHTLPSLDNLVNLAEILGVTVDEILRVKEIDDANWEY